MKNHARNHNIFVYQKIASLCEKVFIEYTKILILSSLFRFALV